LNLRSASYLTLYFLYMLFKDSLMRRSNFLFLSKTSSFVNDFVGDPNVDLGLGRYFSFYSAI